MARKWSNLNLPGALHYVTGNCINRLPVFTQPACCKAFLNELKTLDQDWPSKLIVYVLMPDHFHLIVNPRDGRIKELIRDLKSRAAKAIVQTNSQLVFPETEAGHQVWQESFKDMALWTGWMIRQKINYIHANPVKAGLVKLPETITGQAFAPSTLKVMSRWQLIMAGGGQMIRRSCRRR